MKRVFLATCVFLAAVLLAAADDSKLDSVGDYARWVKPWLEHATNSAQLGGVELKAAITTVIGERPVSAVTNLTALERLNLSYHLRTVGTEIATNGLCWSYSASNTESRGTPVRQLSADELQRLDNLLAQLPDDDLTLPPPGRRLVVQVLEPGRWRVRVYDRNAPPGEVVSLLNFIANPFDKSP
jgi:hypothetical protein